LLRSFKTPTGYLFTIQKSASGKFAVAIAEIRPGEGYPDATEFVKMDAIIQPEVGETVWFCFELPQLYRMYRKSPKKLKQKRQLKQLKEREKRWSGREDLNLRPPGPEL
jgi:hypothetical protein